jgi:1-acyl-sn-glycerol-3-phosphate acyltransferase
MKYPKHPLSFGECAFRLIALPLMRRLWDVELMAPGPYIDFERPCFVYGNHSHNFDPFILNMYTPWRGYTTGILTQEYFRGKITRKILTDIQLRPTRKHVPEPHLIRDLYRMIEAKHAIVIYPEGGRRWDGRPAPWIESTAKVFVRSGIPIYPVVMHGSYTAWPRWASYPRRSRIRVEVKEPLRFERGTPMETALAQLKAPIAFDENLVPDDLKPYQVYRPAQGIHRLLYRDPVSGTNGGVFTRDGTYVENAAGTFHYRMQHDSTLLDEKTGEVWTTGQLFDRVQALPLEPDVTGCLVRNRVIMHTEEQFPRLDPHGLVEAALFPDEIRIDGSSLHLAIPLEDVRYTGIERNAKLQITLGAQMVQLTFDGDGSALQWEHTIQRLKAAEATAERA